MISETSRLLIVKLSSIGDVVHALPVATALRRRYPGARISWAAEEWTAPLVIGHRAIDRVIVVPTMRWGHLSPTWVHSVGRALRVLRREPHDVSLDLQGLLKSSLVALLSAAPTRLGVAGQREGAGWISRPLPIMAGRRHAVDDLLHAATYLGAAATAACFDLPVSAEAARAISTRLSGLGVSSDRPLIIINPSTSVAWKDWPLLRWAAVGRSLARDAFVVLIGNRAQVARHAQVALLARDTAAPRVIDLTGRTTLAELVALLAGSTLHIAGDTGSAHIAAALGRPVIGIYGPTPPWRRAPYGQEARVVYRADQCATACPRHCPLDYRCLDVITAQEVVARARAVLEE